MNGLLNAASVGWATAVLTLLALCATLIATVRIVRGPIRQCRAQVLYARVLLQIAPQAVLHRALLFTQSEIHQRALPVCGATANFGSRGMPRPRSAMMFFWICAVPPPMIRPSWNM